MIGGRRLLALAGIVVGATSLGTMAQAADGPRPTAPAKPAVGFSEPTIVGAFPSVSDDGRWVVYQGEPTDGSGRDSTIWLRDNSQFGADPIELSPRRDEVATGDSVRPVISGDGCVVAFITEMPYDLFRDDDTGARWDVYRVVLPQCDGGDLTDLELVSTQSSADGDTSALDRVDPADPPAVSQVGTVIAFTHQAREGKDPLLAVTVVDLGAPLGNPLRNSLVAGTPLEPPNTTFRYLGQRQADVSDDGRFVAFTSDAVSSDPDAPWADGPVDGGFATSQVYVWDRTQTDPGAAVELVSAVDGAAAQWGAETPAISGNGQFVAFTSVSPELAGDAVLPACGGVCAPQVYRADLAEHVLALVSRANTDPGDRFLAADQGAAQPTITDDGTQVGFVTRSRNLFLTTSAAGASPTDGDVVVSEVDRGIIRRVSTLPDRVTPAAGGNAHPQLSGTGHVVVFDSVNADAINGFADRAAGREVVAVSRPAQLTIPSLDVGTVAVLLPGPEWYVPVRNEGPSTFVPSTVETDNPEFTVTGGTCQLGVPVPPGESCTVKIVLTPLEAGQRSGHLTVSESLFGGTSVTSEVLGQGGEPTLYPTYSGLDFPATAVGQSSATLSSDIDNIGFGPIRIVGFAVTGDDPEDFAVVGDSCHLQPVNPSASCSFDVAFTPTESGHRTATILAFTEFGQYTSVLVDGDGTRFAELVVATPEVRAGDEVGLGGTGFRPNTEVTLSWADGRGDPVTITTDATGGFLYQLSTRATEPVGSRTLVATSGDQITRADVRILRNPKLASQRPGTD
ncbi:MAG: choice-of-anchor D domain-containing protein [Acidimicrobiales bacterium]